MSLPHVSHLVPGETIFRDEHGSLWIVESRCDDPTVTMRKIYPPARQDDNIKVTAVVGCRLFDLFTQLVPKENR